MQPTSFKNSIIHWLKIDISRHRDQNTKFSCRCFSRAHCTNTKGHYDLNLPTLLELPSWKSFRQNILIDSYLLKGFWYRMFLPLHLYCLLISRLLAILIFLPSQTCFSTPKCSFKFNSAWYRIRANAANYAGEDIGSKTWFQRVDKRFADDANEKRLFNYYCSSGCCVHSKCIQRSQCVPVKAARGGRGREEEVEEGVQG